MWRTQLRRHHIFVVIGEWKWLVCCVRDHTGGKINKYVKHLIYTQQFTGNLNWCMSDNKSGRNTLYDMGQRSNDRINLYTRLAWSNDCQICRIFICEYTVNCRISSLGKIVVCIFNLSQLRRGVEWPRNALCSSEQRCVHAVGKSNSICLPHGCFFFNFWQNKKKPQK